MIIDLFNTRSTTRVFDQTPLPEEHIQKIVDAALLAPSKNCIFPYRVEVYTQSKLGRACKQHLYRNVCTTEWDIAATDQLGYDFDRSNITTPNIHMFQVLDQLRAPVVMAFIGKFIDDRSQQTGFFSEAADLKRSSLQAALDNGNREVIVRIVRDAMLACSWAQIQAQELGYASAFVGNAGQHYNDTVNLKDHIHIDETETVIVYLCIGQEAEIPPQQSRCVASEYIVNGDSTTVVFHETSRKGERAYRNAAKPAVDLK